MARDHLDAHEARAKAAECRDDAERSRNPEHKILLEHMAKTWDRIAKSMENGS